MKVETIVQYNYFESPVGKLLIAGTTSEHGDALAVVGFPGGKMRVAPEPEWRLEEAGFPRVHEQLGQYFAGERTTFSLDLQPEGTDFQVEVWRALEEIPYGTTVSYRDVAEMIGRPTATRAIGAANGQNPLPIVVPCHRVIGADGSLTGFGGGLDTKRYLLELEGAPIVNQRGLSL